MTVEEYSLPRPDETARLVWRGKTYPVTGFQESLVPQDSQAIACYDSGWLQGKAALCEKTYPKGGRAWYAGAGFSESLAEAFLNAAGAAHPYSQIVDCPPPVELAVRSNGKEDWLILLNYAQQPQPIHVDEEFVPIIGEMDCLKPLGVGIWKRNS